MANYYATARSNYFKVKDLKAFKKRAEELYLEVIDQKTEAGETLYGIMAEDGDGWPTVRDTNESERPDGEEVDFPAELANHLAPGEVAVLMQAGSERRRYLTGPAVAVTSDGRRSEIVLDNIYEQASREFGIPEDVITRAEY